MSDGDRVLRPAPPISVFNKPYWDYARAHELRLQHCSDCEKPWSPPGPVCPFCFSRNFTWEQMSGFGHIASFTIYHKDYHPYFKDHLPYNVAFVELDEGPRLIANILAPNDELQSGMRVSVVFEDVDDRFTIPQFRPVTADA